MAEFKVSFADTSRCLESALGKTLQRVRIAIVPGELNTDWRTKHHLISAFGPVLEFSTSRVVHLTWDQVGGPSATTPLRYYVIAMGVLPQLTGSIELVEATPSELWAPICGTPLLGYRLIGVSPLVHAVELHFTGASITVVNGTIEALGDSDDITMSEAPVSYPTGWQVIARGGAV